MVELRQISESDDPLYLVGDSRFIKDIFPVESIGKPNLVITSPPYFTLKNYEDNGKQIGHGQSYKTYLDDLAKIFEACCQLTTESATLWMVVDTFKAKDKSTVTLPFDIVNKLKDNQCRWSLRDIIIWNKTKNIPYAAKGYFKNHFEYILFFTKNDEFVFNIDETREISDLKKWWVKYPERYSPNGVSPSNIWEITTRMKGWGHDDTKHVCPFPLSLAERIISIASNPGDLVFDPFAGSGSVLAMSKVMGRRSIGIDVNNTYREEFSSVLREAKRHWDLKQKELIAIKARLSDFRIINMRLRKLKVAARWLKEYRLGENGLGQVASRIVCLGGRDQDHSIEMIIVNDDLIQASQVDATEKVDALISQAGINVLINRVDLEELVRMIKGKQIYTYQLDRPSQYNDVIVLSNNIERLDANGTLFSDIGINISKPTDIEKKSLDSLLPDRVKATPPRTVKKGHQEKLHDGSR
ncbi:MAG: site-specific DNA-methyltransferase [Methanomassiliicoccus sp.]|nr:site-specific DNA-methyltransferase [Methanomassiliicoccus sp.]